MANVIAAIIGEQPCDFDCNDSDVQGKLITKLTDLFTQVAPDKELELRFKNAKKERTYYGHDDILGTLNVSASNKNIDFRVEMKFMHGQVFLKKQVIINENLIKEINANEKLAKCETIETSLILLKKDWKKKVLENTQNTIYKLYQTGCSDNDQKIDLLKKLIQINQVSHQGQLNWNFNHWTINPITQLFNDIGWEDGQIYEDNKEVIEDNIQNILSLAKLRKCIYHGSQLTVLDFSKYPQLRYLDCSDCSNLRSLDVTQCPQLQYIDCSECPNLRSLDVTQCPQLQKLICESLTVKARKNQRILFPCPYGHVELVEID